MASAEPVAGGGGKQGSLAPHWRNRVWNQLPPCFLADSDELYEVALLLDELRHQDVQVRVNAMRQLPRIGLWQSRVQAGKKRQVHAPPS